MIKKLIAGIADILECDASELDPDIVFRELPGWDSLAYLSTVAMIDEKSGVLIPQADFKNLKTIADIAEYIESAMA